MKGISILLESIGSLKKDIPYDDLLISVTTDGYIYYYPIKKELQEYLFNSKSNVPPLIPSILQKHPEAFSNPKLAITDIVAFTPNLKPQCVGKFNPIPEKSIMSATL